jgi:hypothetical protein
MRESGAAIEPAGGLLSPELQRILFNAEERQAFLERVRAYSPPRDYELIANRLTTLKRFCERVQEPGATLDELREILGV